MARCCISLGPGWFLLVKKPGTIREEGSNVWSSWSVGKMSSRLRERLHKEDEALLQYLKTHINNF